MVADVPSAIRTERVSVVALGMAVAEIARDEPIGSVVGEAEGEGIERVTDSDAGTLDTRDWFRV